jgi:adenylosuccinate synthase
MPGWRTSTAGITQFEKLPKVARDYLAFIERHSGARIGVVSTGPGREETIFVDKFCDTLHDLTGAKTKAQAKQ